MVWCMKNGVIWNTSAEDVLESEWMWELKKLLCRRDIKIVEDEFDDYGRPKVKIVYMDAGDWTYKYTAKTDYYRNFIMDSEKKMMAKLNNNHAQTHHQYQHQIQAKIKTLTLEEDDDDEHAAVEEAHHHVVLRRPRLIFVTQDRDYWPGSENDPEAMERRAHKAENFFGLEVGPTGMGFDYKRIVVPTEDNDYHSDFYVDDKGFVVVKDERYIRYFDPSLPGAKFIRENMHPIDLKILFPRLEAVAKKLGWSWPPGCDGLSPPEIS